MILFHIYRPFTCVMPRLNSEFRYSLSMSEKLLSTPPNKIKEHTKQDLMLVVNTLRDPDTLHHAAWSYMTQTSSLMYQFLHRDVSILVIVVSLYSVNTTIFCANLLPQLFPPQMESQCVD